MGPKLCDRRRVPNARAVGAVHALESTQRARPVVLRVHPLRCSGSARLAGRTLGVLRRAIPVRVDGTQAAVGVGASRLRPRRMAFIPVVPAFAPVPLGRRAGLAGCLAGRGGPRTPPLPLRPPTPRDSERPLSLVWLRPPRHPGPVPGMWGRCLRHTLGMTRRLLNLLTWLSLLMFLATVIMSARAVHTWDVFHVQTPGHVLFLSVGRAHAMVGGWSRAERDPAPHGFLRHQSLTPADRQKHWQAFVAPYLLWQFA